MSAAEVAQQRHFASRTYASVAYVAEQDRRYKAMWSIFGWEWVNLFYAAARAVNTIPGEEHGTLNPAFHATRKQIADLMVQLTDMSWFKGLQLRPGTYNNLLIMGAKYKAMVERAKMLKARLDKSEKPSDIVRFRKMFALSGQRPRSDKLDGSVEQIYADLSNETKTHPWVQAQMLLQQNDNAHEPFHGAFATEFELIILSIIVAWNGAIKIEADGYEPCYDDKPLPDVPPRSVKSITLGLPGGLEIVTVNAPAVERPYGPPRPTSISTTQYLIENYGLSGGTVVVVTVRVHGRRMLGDSERTIHSIDPTIKVIGYAASIEGDPINYFPHAMAEAVNQLVKAVEETLNDMRPTGSKPLDLKAVRALLDRLYASPTNTTLLEIFREVMSGE